MNDYAERLTNVARRMDYPNRRPRDAATLIVVDSNRTEPAVLMGKRHERHAFLPGKFVFPGGRVDPGDSRIAVPDRLERDVERKLLIDMKGKPSPRRAQALALAAIRETWEETGLLIGSRRETTPLSSRSRAWRPFIAQGLTPALSAVSFVCRAITPPRRPRRYDTRFFCVSAEHVAHSGKPAHTELLDLHWLPIGRALELDLPIITRVVLEELSDRLDSGGPPYPCDPIPYYYMRNGSFRRELL